MTFPKNHHSRTFLLLLALVALFLLPLESGAGRDRITAARQSLAFIGVNIVPMTEGQALLSDQTVVVRDGRIAEIGPRGRIAVPEDAVRIAAAGQYLMPALVDMHVHLEHFDNPAYLQLFLVHGVTSVRSMDGRPNILEWKRGAAAGTLLSPLIHTAGPVLDGDPPARPDNRALRNADEARQAVEEQATAGYDFIKVYTNLSPDAFAAVMTAARARQLPVAGHVPRAVPLEDVLASGIASIEHLGDYASAIEAVDGLPQGQPEMLRRRLALPADPSGMDALASRLARSGVWSVPTMVQADRAIARPEVLERWMADPALAGVDQGMLQYYWHASVQRVGQRLDDEGWSLVEQGRSNRIALTSAFRQTGVNMLVGTDTPQPFVIPGASVHEELVNFVEAGFSPLQTLTVATRDAARFMGQAQIWGTVEPGKRADLLLLEANPLQDIRATRRIAGVVTQGRWLPASRLQAMRESVERVAAASE